MVETRRLIKPSDDFRTAFPHLNFRNRRCIVTSGEQILLVDPTYLADAYTSTDEIASYLRRKGLFLMNFGGDVSVPVWWKSPFLLMPTSTHHENYETPHGVKVLADEIGCDSGSFVFLPMCLNIPRGVRRNLQELLEKNNAVSLRLPAGRWTAYYEQFDAPKLNLVGLYRNIVLKHTPIREVAKVRKST